MEKKQELFVVIRNVVLLKKKEENPVNKPIVNVIGAGLAGSEAAWQIANREIKVNLFEMRPFKTTPAHKTDFFAELVCSNSFRGAGLENAVGLLKEELRVCNSLIMHCADLHSIPAGHEQNFQPSINQG